MDEDADTLELFAIQTAFECACVKGRVEVLTKLI